MARIIAIRRKRVVHVGRARNRGVTIAVRGMDITVKPSRKRQP